MMRTISSIALAASLALLVPACGTSRPAADTSKKTDVSATGAVPSCPDAILPGGDPLEADGFEGKPVVRVCVIGQNEQSRKAAERVIAL